jgi:hypothetical protein
VAFASDTGKIWIVLRPTTRGGSIGPNLTTLQALLAGPRKVPVGR